MLTKSERLHDCKCTMTYIPNRIRLSSLTVGFSDVGEAELLARLMRFLLIHLSKQSKQNNHITVSR